jgi:hypothetical protein
MMNYQTHLDSSRQLEEAFQNEAQNAQNAEVKSFYEKLASEQRTISNQLQSKVGTQTQQMNQQNQQMQQQNQQQAQTDNDQTNA